MHEGAPLISRHIELSPHGFGKHGFLYGSGIFCNGTVIEKQHYKLFTKSMRINAITFFHVDEHFHKNDIHTCIAASKWISSETRATRAHWTMVNHSTICVRSTVTWTWIDTFIIHTGFICSAFRTYCAFRATPWWRSYVIRHARTYALTVYWTTNAIWTTWIWHAWCCDVRYRI